MDILCVLVRRNETICCLIGFGIGVGCCILYRLISNFLCSPSSSTTATSIANNTLSSLSNTKRDVSSMFSLTASNETKARLYPMKNERRI